MSPSLTSVAQRAGVSLSTASRAFSQPERIGADTLTRIRAAADELGYRAPTSRTENRPLTVAVVVPDVSNPVWADFVKSAQTQAFFTNNTLVLVDGDGSAERERALVSNLVGRVNAFIIGAPRHDPDELVELCDGAPVVLVNQTSDACHCVVVDNESGLRQSVDYLHALGHTHIAYLQGSPQSWSNSRRVRAIDTLTTERNLDLSLLGWQQETAAGGHAAAATMLASGATAVIAHNDPMALGMVQGLRSLGASVPGDVSVIGTDRSTWTEQTNPELTTIEVPLRRAAILSTNLIAELTDPKHDKDSGASTGNTQRVQHLSTQLVVGRTSGAAPQSART